MKVLVTGHMGFVGRHFMEALKEHEVVGIDIKEGNDCRDFFKYRKGHFDLVIHLAAIVGGRATIEGEPLTVATDLSIDAEFFNWVSITKPTDVVYFSSSAAYPTSLQNNGLQFRLSERDINLDRISNPDLTYGWAKLTGEMLSEFVTDSNMYVFRPFSGYGSDQDNSYPFPAFIDRAIAKADPFDIWGDGEQVRDFIHIEDIVAAVIHHVTNKITGTFNLCTGEGTSFNQLAKDVCDLAGYTPEFRHNLDAPEGVRHRVGNQYLSHSFYVPKISLVEGIQRALVERAQAVE